MKNFKFLMLLLGITIFSGAFCMQNGNDKNSPKKRKGEFDTESNQPQKNIKLNNASDSLDNNDKSNKDDNHLNSSFGELFYSLSLSNSSLSSDAFNVTDFFNFNNNNNMDIDSSDNNPKFTNRLSFSHQDFPSYNTSTYSTPTRNNNNWSNSSENQQEEDQYKFFAWSSVPQDIGGALMGSLNRLIDYKKNLDHICEIEITLPTEQNGFLKINGGHFKRNSYQKVLTTPVNFPLFKACDLTFDVLWHPVSSNKKGFEIGYWKISATKETQNCLGSMIKQALQEDIDSELSDESIQGLVKQFNVLKEEIKKLLCTYVNNPDANKEYDDLMSKLAPYGYTKNTKNKKSGGTFNPEQTINDLQDVINDYPFYIKLNTENDKDSKRTCGNIKKIFKKSNFPSEKEIQDKIKEYKDVINIFKQVQAIDVIRNMVSDRGTSPIYRVLYFLVKKFLESKGTINFEAITIDEILLSIDKVSNSNVISSITDALLFYLNNLDNKTFYKISTLFPWNHDDGDLAAGILASYYSNKVPLPTSVQKNEEQNYAYQINIPYEKNQQLQFFIKYHSQQNDPDTRSIELTTCYPLLVFDELDVYIDRFDTIQAQNINEPFEFITCQGYEDQTKEPKIIQTLFDTKKEFYDYIKKQIEDKNNIQKLYNFEQNQSSSCQLPREQKDLSLVEVLPLTFILVKNTSMLTSSIE